VGRTPGRRGEWALVRSECWLESIFGNYGECAEFWDMRCGAGETWRWLSLSVSPLDEMDFVRA